MPATLPFIDIHTHKVEDKQPGVVSIRNCMAGDSLPETEMISVGLHPWYISEDHEEKIKIIHASVTKENVLAVGECGLDKTSECPFELQEQLFVQQIKIAEAAKKPLIVHCVKAFDHLLRIKKEQKTTVPFIVHGFNNKMQTAEQLLKHDIYLSFGKALLSDFSNTSSVIRECPPEKIFLETDNADISIKRIFESAAQLRKTTIEDLKQIIHTNFKNVFHHG